MSQGATGWSPMPPTAEIMSSSKPNENTKGNPNLIGIKTKNCYSIPENAVYYSRHNFRIFR
ncbi:hypothetical protein EB093_04305 [bacterium]|nr:hypothetical protein [bacterium]